MRTPALRIGASIATGLVVAAGVLTATPALAADEPTSHRGLVVNEVESNGDDTDWVELKNTSDTAVDIGGFTFRDSDDSHSWTLPTGTVVEPGGYTVIDQPEDGNPGFGFGLGDDDSARLFDTTDTLVLAYSWTTHADVTWGRCADGTGEFVDTSTRTKGTANGCSPVRINEIESSDANGGDDWVELTNTGAKTFDLGGSRLTDSEPDKSGHEYTIPAGTTIAPGAFVVLEQSQFGFGLGGADAVRLLAADGTTLVDSSEWTVHAATTYGRNPDGTGDFAETSAPTKGAANAFAGVVPAQAWPGSPDETVADAAATYSGDMSGLDWQADATATDGGILWGVQNGDGLLYRLTSDGAGGWNPTNAAGTTLHYADGSGTPDAEGVTVAADDPGAVYVSTERNNDASSVSRPAVLRFATTDGSASSLNATDDWNLAADFPGLGANSGLEGVTWIPDSWLTAHGFVDEHTGAAYAPSTYAGHGGGLFFVGVEGTASVYAYALMDDGSSQRVATIGTPFSIVADVQFDATLDALWVVCDEACDGRTALFTVQDGSFAAESLYDAPANANTGFANEGFAISDVCTDGSRTTFYADDAATDGHSIRTGTYPCTDDGSGETPSPGDGGTPAPGDGGTPNPSPGEGEGGTPTPTPGPSPGEGSTPSPMPGGGSTTPTPSVPVAPSESSLTGANRGSVSAPSSARPGETVTIGVGVQYAGDRVNVWMFSTPTLLGTITVGADGTVSATIPSDAPAGQHRIVVTAADGTVLGWTTITIDPATGALAFTGADLSAGIAAALLLLAAGVGVLVVRRRRTVRAA